MNLFLYYTINNLYKKNCKIKYVSNYERKAYILNEGIDQELSNLSKHMTFNTCNKIYSDSSFKSLLHRYNIEDIKEGLRVLDARSQRARRLKHRIERIIQSKSYFLTFTFTDDVLRDTKPETRRRYVARFLRDISSDYVANIDFGEKNGREHYHAVVSSQNIPLTWSYGALNFKSITYGNCTSDKLAKYVSKLTNHAIKETTKRQALIYPKKHA